MIDTSRIRAVSLDLDDTLWPIWPTIARAEAVLHDWLRTHAPTTAQQLANPQALRAVREEIQALRPDLAGDLIALRRESIRLALQRAGDDPALAEPAFEAFYDERQRVELFDGARECLAFLSARFPVVAVTNGNADIHRVGIGGYFQASLSAHLLGIAKPDPRIFHAAAAAVNVAPHEVLHVGDDATLDAHGALEAGLQTVWFNPEGRDWPHERTPPVAITRLQDLRPLLG